MSQEITNIRLKFACQQNWDEMTPVTGGRLCNDCHKIVYDFTNTKADEFRKILAENPAICGRYRKDQVVYAPLKLPVWKKWISAAAVLLGFGLFGKASAQTLDVTTPQDTLQMSGGGNPSTANTTQFLLGSVEQSAEFPGGLDKFKTFIANNLSYKGKAKGKVIVTFIVDERGALLDPEILRGVSDEAANKDVIRVLKQSPKWKPGIQNGHPISQQYTVPVSFN